MDDARNRLVWNADEHRHVEHGSDWYWALGVVAVATSLTAIIFGDVLFGMLIIIAAIAMGIFANTPPRKVEFEISQDGVRTGDTMHHYDEIISFWVDETTTEPLLLIDTMKPLSPNLVIPIESVSPDTVREAMRPHAREVLMREPISHKILEFFGF